MSCCGNRRNAESSAPSPTSFAPAHVVELQYVGASTLRARGPVTQRDYWFARPGARVRVDARDAPALEAIPNLARSPTP